MWIGVRTRAWAPAGHRGCTAVQDTPGRAPGTLLREGQMGRAVGAGTPPWGRQAGVGTRRAGAGLALGLLCGTPVEKLG